MSHSPLGLLSLLLLLLESLQSLLLDSLDLLSHAEELDHLLDVDLGRDVLGNTELILLVQRVLHLVVFHLVSVVFSLLSLVLFLLLLLSIGEGSVDDGKGQVQQEEGTHEHDDDEEEDHEGREAPPHDHHHIGPAFQGHALEGGEERVQHIVEVGHSVVWILVGLAAEVASRTVQVACTELLNKDDASLEANTPVLQSAREELGAGNGHHQEEEEQDDDSVSEQGQGGKDGAHEDLETLDTVDTFQGSQHSESPKRSEGTGAASGLLRAHLLLEAGLSALISELLRVRHDHHEAIEPVRRVFQVRVVIHDETHTDHLEEHLHSVEVGEGVINEGHDLRLFSSWVLKHHVQGVHQNDGDGHSVEPLGADDGVANDLNRDSDSLEGLSASEQWEPISLYLKFLQVSFGSNGKDVLILPLDFLDVGVLLEANHVFLLPIAHGLESGLLELLEPQTLGVIV